MVECEDVFERLPLLLLWSRPELDLADERRAVRADTILIASALLR